MRRLICRLLLTLLLALPLACRAETASLTILHTNDTHSHLLPFSNPIPKRDAGKPEAAKAYVNIGGIARRATLIRRLRAELEAAGTAVWVMDGGDFSDGTPFSIEYKGEADAEAMNAAGYTLGTLGNHEFNYTRAQLEKLVGMFKYPVLAANVADAKTGKPLAKEYEIIRVGPVKVGVFGLVTYEARSYPAAREGIKVSGEVAAARRMVAALAKEKADVVILLSHCGEDKDVEIAEKVPGIAAIVGGHSHSRLPFGRLVRRAKADSAEVGEGTVLVQAHQWGGELGRLDLTFAKGGDGAWGVAKYKASLIPVNSDIPDDPAVAAAVERRWRPIADKYEKVVGTATADFSDKGSDQPAYNLMADALRATYGTDIALENVGGVRAPLLEGDVTFAALAAMDPFDNTVVKFRVRGDRLRKILQAQKPAVSGMKYRIENKELREATVGGAPLEDGRYYTGVTNSYFARIILKGVQSEDTGRQRLDVLTEYVRKLGSVSPVYDSRRVVR